MRIARTALFRVFLSASFAAKNASRVKGQMGQGTFLIADFFKSRRKMVDLIEFEI